MKTEFTNNHPIGATMNGLRPGKAWRPPVCCWHFAVSTYTYSTQSDPMGYVRSACKQNEWILNLIGLPWRKVVDADNSSTGRDWYGRTFSIPHYACHYEVRMSKNQSWHRFAATYAQAYEHYFANRFGADHGFKVDAEHLSHLAGQQDEREQEQKEATK